MSIVRLNFELYPNHENRCINLCQIAKAHRYYQESHPKGKIVITLCNKNNKFYFSAYKKC